MDWEVADILNGANSNIEIVENYIHPETPARTTAVFCDHGDLFDAIGQVMVACDTDIVTKVSDWLMSGGAKSAFKVGPKFYFY